MLHTAYSKSNEAGLASPPGKDIVLYSDGPDAAKAYDPAKAKYLARADRGGMDVAMKNVDNMVYYALYKFVHQRWGVIASLPEAEWKVNEISGHPDYINGVTTLAPEEYRSEANESLSKISDMEWFGGRSCATDEDFQKSCPPIYRSGCSDDKCVCLFGFDPLPPS